MKNSSESKFKLSKKIKLLSKIVGYNTAFNLLGSGRLGQGQFGSVYSSKGAAVKVAHPKKEKELEHEVKMLEEVKGVKVAPKLLASGKGYAAIQKFEGKPLSKYTQRLNKDPVFADYIFRKVVEAIGALHRKNIAQRDLHAGNIFITDDYEVKILDYGQAAKGIRYVYYELIFGNNDDINTGAIGLIHHLFKNCQSYKTYKRILRDTVKKICSIIKADSSIVFLDYETIDGDDEKVSEYFDEIEKLSSLPSANRQTIINSFYNAVDSALRINTKNPSTFKRVSPKSPFVPRGGSVQTITKPSTIKSSVLKFEQGGVVPAGNHVVELHGKELVLPKNAIKLIRKNGRDYSEIAVGTLIAYGIFPHTTEGIEKAKKVISNSEYWIAPSELPNYYDGIDSDLMVGKQTPGIRNIRQILEAFYKIGSSAGTADFEDTQVYNPADKFVDDAKEFADKVIDDLDVALEEKSDEIMDAVDAIIAEDKRKIEEFKAKVTRKVNHPELFPELQHIKTRYMWGQNGLYDLEFKSDIDRAIYFAGKLGGNNKDSQDKVAVRQWLFLATGLNVRDDYEEVKEYRAKILDFILQLIKLNPNETEVIVPPIYDGYYQDPDEDEEDEEEMDDEEYDDLYGSNLDDLLNEVREDEEQDPDGQKVAEDIEEEILDAAEEDEDEEENLEGLDDLLGEIRNEDKEQEIDSDVLSDLPPSLQESLVNIINRKTGKKINLEYETQKSSSITNTKIYNFLTQNLTKVVNELNSINASIKEQNLLLKSNIDLNIAMLQSIENQDSMIASKLDVILDLYTNQTNSMKKIENDLKKQEIESKLEAQRDSAFTSSFTKIGEDTSKTGGLFSRLLRFLGGKLWKLLPRRLRAKARLLKRGLKPTKLLERFGSKIARKKLADKAAQKTTQKFVAKGFEHIALPALKSSDNVAAKGITKSSDNILVKALKSRAVQKALTKKLGKEGAEKLTLKIAGKLIPGVSTAYGLGEGIARMLMGDIKGGFLSFGSAIPIAGWGFAAVDILRDIDPVAYTKHIEGPAQSGKLGDEQFAAFIAEALGVTENQYEAGTPSAKPGVAMLHGTELVIKKDERLEMEKNSPLKNVGGSLLSATTNYINALGPLASSIAPTFKQIAAPIAEEYGLPKVLTQTNVGGALPSFTGIFDKIKQKKFESEDKMPLELEESETFAEKIMNILKNPFDNFINSIRNKINGNDAPLINGDPLMAEGGAAVDTSDIYSKYGMREGKMHYGIDISSSKFEENTPISVIKSGVVKFAGWQDPNNKRKGWGQFVAIQHDDGTASLYGHLNKINVSAGQRIEPDTQGRFPVIGTLGDTGKSSGPHLHFEVGTKWTGGTLTGHVNPVNVVGQYLRGGGNVKAIKPPDAKISPGPSEDINNSISPNQNKSKNQNEIIEQSKPQVLNNNKSSIQTQLFKSEKINSKLTNLKNTPSNNEYDIVNIRKINETSTNINKEIHKVDSNVKPPTSNRRERFESMNKSGTDASSKLLIVNQQSQPTVNLGGNTTVQFIPMGPERWVTKDEYSDSMKKLIMSRLSR